MARNPLGGDQVDVEIREEEKTRQLRLKPEDAGVGDGDHTWPFQGPLNTVDGVAITPHKVTVASGQAKALVAHSSTGPMVGTCDVYIYLNGVDITSDPLPIPLADGDLLAPFLDASPDAESISVHFTIVTA